MDFYGRDGSAVAYLYNETYIYLWSGKPVGHLYQDRVYRFSGRQLGWFTNGWLYDRSNHPALFTGEAHGGPVKPVRKVRPVKGVKQVKPVSG